MKAVEFCYWLQGFFELLNAEFEALAMPSQSKQLHESQVEMIERHLALVFKHDIDPKAGTPEHQAELQAIHDGTQHAFGTAFGIEPDGGIFRC
jgi:hypothetical protein